MKYIRIIFKAITDVRFLYALVGIVLSIVAHELFHVLVHAGNITKIEFFSDFYSIVTITSIVPRGYDFVAEEFIAYSISTVILFITFIDVVAIHDSRSK